MSGRILVVDDDADMSKELGRALGKRGFDVTTRTSADEAYTLLQGESFDAVVTDLNMKGMNGIELCDRVVQSHPRTPVIVVTGFGSMETAIATLRAGAFDFLTKPFSPDQLALSLERALKQSRLEEEVRRLRQDRDSREGFEGFVGESAPMQRIFDLVARVAPTDATVRVQTH